MENRQPNILYFVADQMRCDAQHHLGNQAAVTPNLDALLEDGVSFRNAYCQNPVCVPSRCSFMTGLYPHTTGHRTMHFLQREDESNILREMKNAGYEVIWIGRNDLIPADRSKAECCDAYYDGIRPYDTKDVCEPLQYSHGDRKEWNDDMYSFYIGNVDGYGKVDEGCVDACLNYLKEKQERNDGKPFFVYCTLSFPHPPYGVSEPWFSMIDRNSLPPRKPLCPDKAEILVGTADNQKLHGWSEERWNELRAVYLGMVAKWDSQFGMVMDRLKECGFYDNTSVFVFSDHGDYTGDYDIVEKLQNCFENDLSNIPLLIKPANQFACVPRITGALAELVDLTPTVCEMTGTKLSYVQYGKSLLHVLAGDEEHKDAVFCEGGRPDGDTYAKEAGHEDPHDPYWPRLSLQQKDGGPHARATMIRMGNLKYTMRMYGRDELYDLEIDPDETINRIDDPTYEKEVIRMKLRMLEWYQQTADCIPSRKDKR